MARLRNPKKAPTNVKGTDTPNHKASSATNVRKGIAADDPLYHRTKFIMKKWAKTTPGQSIEVRRTLDFHFSPPKLLYIRADMYPAGVPRQTYNTNAHVIKA